MAVVSLATYLSIGIYTNFIVQRHARREAGIQLHGGEDWIPFLVSGFRLSCRNDGVLQKLCRYLCYLRPDNPGENLSGFVSRFKWLESVYGFSFFL